MLCELQIKNYALIRSLHIGFDAGFTAITGETGAGKSILMGALSLILGNRADTSVLFDKSKKCVVEALFDISDLHLEPFFEENDLDFSEKTIVRREISENGKSRAFINDTPVVLAVLKDLASKLVDIHSQHNNLLLNDSSFRLKVLDDYADNRDLLKQYAASFSKYVAASKRCQELLSEQRKGEEERGFWEYTASELENARLVDGEQEELENSIAFLSNAQSIKQKLYSAAQLLVEQENSVVERLQDVKSDFNEVSDLDKRLQDFVERLETSQIELKDLAFDISKLEDSVEVRPEELEQKKERLDLIYSLEQKYRLDSVAQLIEKLEDTRAKLTSFSTNEEAIEKARTEVAECYRVATELASRLSERRGAVLARLETELHEKFSLLGMPNACLHIALKQSAEIGESGSDSADFLFSANKGSQPLEIAKVASGGEISRVMLAIKSVISTKSYLPTVIFDEIDTGISGDVANKTARVMEDLAAQRQLLVITHLPQIAAKARLHYFVYKIVENERTYSQIRKLMEQEREVEIAKMIGGEEVSVAARQTARELLAR